MYLTSGVLDGCILEEKLDELEEVDEPEEIDESEEDEDVNELEGVDEESVFLLLFSPSSSSEGSSPEPGPSAPAGAPPRNPPNGIGIGMRTGTTTPLLPVLWLVLMDTEVAAEDELWRSGLGVVDIDEILIGVTLEMLEAEEYEEAADGADDDNDEDLELRLMPVAVGKGFCCKSLALAGKARP